MNALESKIREQQVYIDVQKDQQDAMRVTVSEMRQKLAKGVLPRV